MEKNEYINDIAVIGMSGKFPGADNLEEFWENLVSGNDCIGDVPDSRLKNWLPLLGVKVKHLPQWGYLNAIDLFDPRFFGIAPGEAPYIDPAQRLLLETVYQALEYGGYGGDRLANTRTGVFIAVGSSGYKELIPKEDFSMAAEVGNLPAVSAGRISHVFKLQGPSLLIDTACSSSLAALHYACKSILTGESDMAVVGAANVYAYSDGKSASADQDSDNSAGAEPLSQRCRVFDNSASGVVNGEGVAALLLKPLSRALPDGDVVCAVIKGTAVNHNGGCTATVSGLSQESQAEVIRQALENAKVKPQTLSYIEASGAATKMGDPIEIESISEVFSTYTHQKEFCALGSVKANIGHLNHTSGLASVIKVILALQHKQIPPLALFKEPNSYIDFKNTPVYIPTGVKEWDLKNGVEGNKTRRAGISSFSVNGTNCHMILEEAPPVRRESQPLADHYNMVSLSAKDPTVLEKLCRTFKENLKENPSAAFNDVCYTMNAGRGHYEYRLAVVAKNKEELIKGLKTADFSGSRAGAANVFYGHSETRKSQLESKGVFLFSNGKQDLENMCRDFYNKGFIAAKYIDECNALLELEKYPPAFIFAFQYALARLWMDLGITPAYVLGFGTGKYVSHVISKKMTLEEALKKCMAGGFEENYYNEGKFKDNIEGLYSRGQRLFLEIGPGSELGAILKKVLRGKSDFHLLPSYDSKDNERTLLMTISLLYTQGFSIDFSSLFYGQKILLPTYPFNHQRYWIKGVPLKINTYVGNVGNAGISTHQEEIDNEVETFTGHLIPRPQLSTEYIPPSTEFEKSFADILRKFVGLEEVGIHDNFFEIGINSLTIIHINGLLKKKTQTDIPIAAMFEYPNIHSLKGYLHRMKDPDGNEEEEYAITKRRESLTQSINVLRSNKND